MRSFLHISHPLSTDPIRQLARRLATIIAALATVGCQFYQPSPLDGADHTKRWQQRSPSSKQVIEFAEQLESEGKTSTRFNPADGLSLAEAEIIALMFNPELRLARLKTGVAKATAEHAGRWDDPELEFDVLKVTEGVPQPWIIGSGLSLTIPISGRLSVEKSRAKAVVHAELARVAEQEWHTRCTLREAWFEWSAQRTRLSETEHMLESLKSIVESTSQLAESGEIPRTEATLFRIEQQSLKAGLDSLRGRIKENEQEIRSLMGISPTANAQLLPSLANPPTRKQGRLQEENPTLLRLHNEYQVAELTLRREIRKQYPDIEIGPGFEEDQGQSRVGVIGVIPIPLLNSNKGGIATAKAEREVARAVYETSLERMQGRLASLKARLDATHARRQTILAEIVPLVTRQVEDARKLLELGESGSLVLLESLVRAHEAKLSLVDVRLDHLTTHNHIQQLHGPAPLAARK